MVEPQRPPVGFLPLALRGHRLHLPISHRERANQSPRVLRVQIVGAQTPRACGGGPVHTQGIMRHNLWAWPFPACLSLGEEGLVPSFRFLYNHC